MNFSACYALGRPGSRHEPPFYDQEIVVEDKESCAESCRKQRRCRTFSYR